MLGYETGVLSSSLSIVQHTAVESLDKRLRTHLTPYPNTAGFCNRYSICVTTGRSCAESKYSASSLASLKLLA